MNKRAILGLTTVAFLLIAIAGSSGNSNQSNTPTRPESGNMQEASTNAQAAQKAKPLCDGTTVTTSCTVDGVDYSTYIYHPAVAEKSHTETDTTYQEKITGYCTLCNDNTYSPSCATGRGACSWHGGVQEWNAPVYTRVPVYSTRTVIDAPAQDAYYEKVTE